MSFFRDHDPLYDPFYDQTLELNYPYTTTWNDWNNWPINTTDRWNDRWGNRDLGTTDRGARLRVPIQDRIPRHVESRVMTEKEGDVVWRPATDVFETNDYFIIHCDLPGVPKEDISIDLRDRELIVQGESKRATAYETATFRVRERNLGRFRKHIYLPRDLSGEKKDIDAKYENGLLEIKIPRGKQGSIEDSSEEEEKEMNWEELMSSERRQ
ncbi:1203_t:CDS:2 [Dentiscutata heterogama]|uniref:1203_t:CDS:1 n=1 Tax=Dentiscutata heterogama TaxID=1316150 RepID=A0ACA9M1Q4_9GLOM|nr:1203_t:CDS:2 [Dentiscutata heterogama]